MSSTVQSQNFSIDIILQSLEAKECHYCHINSIDKKDLNKTISDKNLIFNADSLYTKHDISAYRRLPHIYGVNHKKSLKVLHLPNQESCHNYKLKTYYNIYEKTSVEPTETTSFQCPRHKKLIKRFRFYKKAQKMAKFQLKKYQLDPNIESVSYNIYDKKYISTGTKFFPNMFCDRFACVINYKHYDASSKCPKHPLYVKQKKAKVIFTSQLREVPIVSVGISSN